MGIPQLTIILMQLFLVGTKVGQKDAEGTGATILSCGILQAILVWGGWYT